MTRPPDPRSDFGLTLWLGVLVLLSLGGVLAWLILTAWQFVVVGQL